MHYYGTLTLTTRPGKRVAAIDHLKELAKLFTEKYDVRTEVLGNVTGSVYSSHLVSRYHSLGQAEEVNAQVLEDPAFLTWFQAAEGLIDWPDARRNLFEVYD